MIYMSDSAAKKNRPKLFELKMESTQREGNWLPRSNSIRGRTNLGASNTQSNERFHKQPQNPEQKLSESSCFLINKLRVNDLNKISNVVFTLPQIKNSALDTQLIQSVNLEEDKIKAYCSAKLEPSLHQKTNKSIASKYYQKIQVLKEMREPIISQRVFTMINIQNQGIEQDSKRQTNLAVLAAKARQKKIVFPTSALQRYQVVRDKEEVAVPSQLQAKSFAYRKGSVSEKKVKMRVSLLPRRRVSRQQQNMGFKLSGWQQPVGILYDY